jgi:hypothetical protein
MCEALEYLCQALTNKGYSVTGHACGVLAIVWTEAPDDNLVENRFNIRL